jgi:NADH-quinone oxidoreductase subunit F
MALIATGQFHKAYELIRQDNPFPAVCGRVCTHPCERHCRRGQVDEPLAIRSLKRFVGDYALRDDYDIPRVESLPATGKRVAIIGAGPSGLTCGYYLATLGHEVDVYEAEAVAGGVLYWGIPEYRLPNEVLAKEIRSIEAAGVKLHLGVKIGTDLSFEQLRAEHDAVYVAIGTQKSRLLGIPGENAAGVESGLKFLQRIGLKKDLSVPKRLAVVGGGSTAMDVAMTAIRLGCKEVTVLYRRTLDEMPADQEDVRMALEEGIRIEPLVSPVSIVEQDGRVAGIRAVRMTEGDFGKDGRRRTHTVPDSEFLIPCEGIITAVNQEVDESFSLIRDEGGTAFNVNKFTSATRQTGVFAGGDLSPWGANVVISAIADGKRAAGNIDKYLGGTGELHKGEPIEIPVLPQEEVTEHPRFPVRQLSAEERVDSFREIDCGYHRLDAMAESLRCLHCDRR